MNSIKIVYWNQRQVAAIHSNKLSKKQGHRCLMFNHSRRSNWMQTSITQWDCKNQWFNRTSLWSKKYWVQWAHHKLNQQGYQMVQCTVPDLSFGISFIALIGRSSNWTHVHICFSNSFLIIFFSSSKCVTIITRIS